MYQDFDDEMRHKLIDIAFEINNIKGDLKECLEPDKYNDIIERLAYLFMKETFLEMMLDYLKREAEERAKDENNDKDDDSLIVVGRRPDLYDEDFCKFMEEERKKVNYE
jgi:hypothetical protein